MPESSSAATASFPGSEAGGDLTGRPQPYSPETVANSRVALRDFLLCLAGLLIITAAVVHLRVEQGAQLPLLMMLCTGGFAVYAWLPLALRLPFFLLLNAAALVLLFGPATAAGTVGFGALLIGLASLPVHIRLRVGLVALAGLGVALVRNGVLGNDALRQVSGVVGTLFMFRIVLYLYETHYAPEKAPLSKRLAYFFLLPNLVFQLFPIVDYKTFIRGHYAQPSARTYRKGLHWIARGVIHLLIYRLIYQYGMLYRDDVESTYQLVQYLVASYALIIRLSGIFHLCAGIMCVFGFDLPRTFDNYFLSSSFSDLWRRINVYWRNFVMKIFYFPIFFRLKHLGRSGIFLTIMLVFVANFLLHAYQWFWIRGSAQITQTDMAFWGVLGLLLAINSILPTKRVSRRAAFSLPQALLRSAKVLGMLAAMCLLWSLWSSVTLENWLNLFRAAGAPEAGEWATLAAAVAVFLVVGAAAQYIAGRWAKPIGRWQDALATPFAAIGIFLAILLLATPRVASYARTAVGIDYGKMLSDELSTTDKRRLSQGYYEDLIDAGDMASKLSRVEARTGRSERTGERRKEITRFEITGMTRDQRTAMKDANRGKNTWGEIKKTKLIQHYDNSIRYRFQPNRSVIFRGVETNTNAFGMRDRNYSLEKPPGTLRMALLGGSPELGLGLPENEMVDNILEDKLSASPDWNRYKKVEILNFSAGLYTMMEQVAVTEHLVGQFKPDVLLLTIHNVNTAGRMRKSIAQNMIDGRADEYEYLHKMRLELGIDSSTDPKTARRLLHKRETDLYRWTLDRIVDFCQKNHIKLAVVYVGVLLEEAEAGERNQAFLFPYLREKHVELFDLQDVFKGRDPAQLMIDPWDFHPNAEGNALVADRLYQLMTEDRAFFDGDKTP